MNELQTRALHRRSLAKAVLRPTQASFGKRPQLLAYIRACSARADINRKKVFQTRVSLSGVTARHQS